MDAELIQDDDVPTGEMSGAPDPRGLPRRPDRDGAGPLSEAAGRWRDGAGWSGGAGSRRS